MGSGAARAARPCATSLRSTHASSRWPRYMSFSWRARSSAPFSTKPSRTSALTPTSRIRRPPEAGPLVNAESFRGPALALTSFFFRALEDFRGLDPSSGQLRDEFAIGCEKFVFSQLFRQRPGDLFERARH